MGLSDLGLIARPSHLLSGVFARFHGAVWTGAHIKALTHLPYKVSSPFIGGRILLQLRCFKVAPKILYHHVRYGRDYCNWLHRKRKLWYTPRNPPPWFLCLELLRLSVWQLHLHQLSLVSSPFIIGGCLVSQAFAPPQLGASTTTLFPSLHALERSSPVVFIKSTRDFCCTQLFTQSLLWASSGKTSSPCTCCLITVPRWILQVLLHNLRVPSCNFCSPDFSLFLVYVWQQLILSQHLSKLK